MKYLKNPRPWQIWQETRNFENLENLFSLVMSLIVRKPILNKNNFIIYY